MGDVDVRRYVQIPVSYKRSTKSGKLLTDLKVDVLVDDQDPNDDNVRISMSINHRCFLNCYFGVGKERSGRECGIMVHQDTCMALKDILAKRGKSVETYRLNPIPTRGTGGIRNAPSGLYSYNYVTTLYRRIFGSIISFIVYLHKHGISIDGELSLDRNLYMKDNEIKFFQLRLVRTDALRTKAEDFKNAAGIIREIIAHKNLNNLAIPPDMEDLLHIMEDVQNFRKENESLMVNHLAILSHSDRIGRIRNFHSKEVFIKQVDKYKYNTAVENMVRSGENAGDWTQRFKRNDLRLGAAQSCFHYGGGGVEQYVGVVNNNRDRITVNKNLLRFCRNLAEHVSSGLANMHGVATVTEMDVELTVMTLFGEELLSFQREAHRSQALHLLL